MLLDTLENAGLYTGVPGLCEALGFLRTLAPGQLPEGRVELAEGRLFANPVRLTTKPESECLFEAHRRYLDVHYIVSGVEGIAVRPVSELIPTGPFDAEKDIGFYSGAATASCWLHPGQFLVCWPGDAHQVCRMQTAPAPVEKVVVKIPVDYVQLPARRVLVFGDSNTYGFNAENGGRFTEAERYPCRLQALLGPGVSVIEEGLPGRTSVFDDPINEGLCGLSYITPCMMSHMPLDTLVIMLGTNDCKERFGCTSTLIGEGLDRLVRKALATEAWRGKPDLVLVAPPAIVPAYEQLMFGPIMGAGCALRAAGLAEEFAKVAAARGCRFLDAGQLPGAGVHPLDGMHLTREAHAALAEGLAALLGRP